ncbi:MAG: hypothetical protein HKN16_09100 [Saprospiraceae bacterium]|nr:hypothetical protein [Saprospiraceae bacterium]
MSYLNLKLILILSFLILHTGACDKNEDPISIFMESAHFIVLTNTNHSNEVEIQEVLDRAEELYPNILEVLGEEREPINKITLRLEGDFVEQGPYFDPDGIHLFRYSQEENGYLALMTHELIHAFREEYYIEYDPWSWENYPFLDEGFAEYVAMMVDSTKNSFPWYGYDAYAVVGDMVLKENLIPFEILRERHHEINQPCHIQTYTQRALWMNYLDETYGRDTLLLLNYPETPTTAGFFENTLGASLVEVDSSWHSWVLEKYNSTPNAAQIADGFRNHTSWYEYCEY